MDNLWDTMRAALQQAKDAQAAVDSHANQMARMLVGRLRKIDRYTLKELKRELQHFDGTTKQWKD